MSEKNIWERENYSYSVMDAYAFLNFPSDFSAGYPCLYCPIFGHCLGKGSSDCDFVRLQAVDFVFGLEG